MRNALFVTLYLALNTIAFGQAVDFDWPSGSLQRPPGNIIQTGPATVTVHRVNDILYSYSVTADCKQNQVSPFETISGFLPQQNTQADVVPGDNCALAINNASSALSKVRTAYNQLISAPTTGTGCSASSPCDIPYDSTKASWLSTVEQAYADGTASVAMAQSSCPAGDSRIADLIVQQNVITDVRTKVLNGSHDFISTVTLIPDASCTLTITQQYRGVQTQNGSKTVTFSSGQPRMSLSAGPLFSQIQDRSYTVVAVPSSSGQGTQNVLQFNGVSKYTTYLTGLLNFNIPSTHEWINSEKYGIALSTGPVVRVGGQSSSSAFGWFGGVSYRLYDLAYVSAGFHVGQFADHPAGFSSPNQVVPANFPTPTAQTRTTARFAFAITLKAKDFSKITSATAGKGTGSPAPATPATGNAGTPNSGGTTPKPATPGGSTPASPGTTTDTPATPGGAASGSNVRTDAHADLAMHDATPPNRVSSAPRDSDAVSRSDEALKSMPAILDFSATRPGTAPSKLMLVLTDANGSNLHVRAKIASHSFAVERVDCDGSECDVVVKRVSSDVSTQPTFLTLLDATGRFIEIPILTTSAH